jgi:carbon storage regulator
MLVLSRKPGESIKLGDQIEVIIIAVEGHRVRIGVNAPREIRIMRSEVDPTVIQSNRDAAEAASKQPGNLAKAAATTRQRLAAENTAKERENKAND